MIKRALFGTIVLASLAILVLAFMGTFRDEPPPDDRRPAPAIPPVPEKTGQDTWTQTFRDFVWPRTDSKGKKESIIEGKQAVLTKNAFYEVLLPKITAFGEIDPKTGEPQIVITRAKTGHVNKLTNLAKLRGNVVIQINEETSVHTEALTYMSAAQKVVTEAAARFVGDDITITGVGMEADLATELITVKKTVDVRLAAADVAFMGSDNSAKSKAKREAPNPVRITCDGPLQYHRRAQTATFENNVAVQKGETELLADRMTLNIDPITRKATRLEAAGNVRLNEASRTARGNRLTWDAESGMATLHGRPVRARFDRNVLEAPRMTFYADEDRFATERGGHLVIETGAKSAPRKPKKRSSIRVQWRGRMVFEGPTHLVTFYQDVVVVHGEARLEAQQVEGFLDDKNQQLRKLRASVRVRAQGSNGFATGDEMIWMPDEQFAILTGTRSATVRRANMVLNSRFIQLNERTGSILASGGADIHLVTEKTGERIDISCLDNMVVKSKDHVAMFYGDVKATMGNAVVYSQKMRVTFAEGNRPRLIKADEQVVISTPEQKGRGDSFVWDVSKRLMVLEGKPDAQLMSEARTVRAQKLTVSQADNRLAAHGPGSLDILQGDGKLDASNVNVQWSRQMVFAEAENRADFVGNVRAKRDQSHLRSEKLHIALDQGAIRQLVATDDVQFSDKELSGRGDELTWDWKADTVVLRGRPAQAKRYGLTSLGDELMLNRKSRQIEIRQRQRRPRIDFDFAP